MKKLLFICPVAAILVFSSFNPGGTAPPPPLYPVPSASQLAWHEMEMNAFIHFTVNTFTDLEWGMGNEPESIFNPRRLDVSQWTTVLKEAGFKGIILTCKHHDGFCLWPSEFTAHSVKNSPFKNGQGDIVKELSDACRKQELQFGVYLSPWDRNHADYGSSAYIQYYRDQLKELFTKYGPVFEMWFDGANGGSGYYGGKAEKRTIDGRTYYEWPNTLNMVRKMQPDVIFFSDAGPGVRWVGNERGIAGETNWSPITPDTLYAGKPGIERLLNEGSENGTEWIPAEVDVSIRPGWFYHEKEDTLVKSPQMLFDIYMTSVGRGSVLLLNVPPDKDGLIHQNDILALKGFRQLLDNTFKTNLAAGIPVTASSVRGNDQAYTAAHLTDNNKESYWATDDDITSASLTLDLEKPMQIKFIILQEYIKLGQRVKRFTIDVMHEDKWIRMAENTTIGYKRIIQIEPVLAQKVRVNILDARACPVLSGIALY